MARKKEMKELKQPDQFVSFWTHLGQWIAKRQRPLMAGLVATLVVVGGIQLSRNVANQKAAVRSRAFARIQHIASAPLLPTEGTTVTLDDDVPHFKTDRERKEAAIKEADAFLAKDPGKLADAANLLKASYLLETGKAAEAAVVYKDLAARSVDPKLRFMVDEGYAYAEEGAGNIDKAIELFGALAESATQQGNFYRDRALFSKARLLEKKGNTAAAETLYREVLDKFPQSTLKEEINDRLAMLEKK